MRSVAKGILLLVCISTGLLAGTTYSGPGSHFQREEIHYTVDMVAVRETFNETGRVHLKVPLYDELIVKGGRHNIGGNNWSEILPNGTTVCHESIAIPVQGWTVEGPEGEATLLLGEYGIYGAVVTTKGTFDFDPEQMEGSGTLVQVARFWP